MWTMSTVIGAKGHNISTNVNLTVGRGQLVKFLRLNLPQTNPYYKRLQSTKIQIHAK